MLWDAVRRLFFHIWPMGVWPHLVTACDFRVRLGLQKRHVEATGNWKTIRIWTVDIYGYILYWKTIYGMIRIWTGPEWISGSRSPPLCSARGQVNDQTLCKERCTPRQCRLAGLTGKEPQTLVTQGLIRDLQWEITCSSCLGCLNGCVPVCQDHCSQTDLLHPRTM